MYYFDGSKGYHIDPNTHDMGGAHAHTLTEGIASGKNACKSCGVPGAEVLDIEHLAWVDEDNRIHTSDDCPSFSGKWRLTSVEDALEAGCEPCADCHGTGCSAGTTPEVCSDCHGTGTVRTQTRTAFGVMSSTTTCSRCGGTGKIIHSPCTTCRGKGSVRRNKKISVNIPAGVDDGMTVSVHGQGNQGSNGGPNGDLLVTITVLSHHLFQRDGTSVLYRLPISITQAALGAELQVPTLDGNVMLKIPEGTQSEAVFRLRGKGIQSLNGGSRGDQFVTVSVQTPKGLTSEQKELLRQLAETFGEGSGTGKKKRRK